MHTYKPRCICLYRNEKGKIASNKQGDLQRSKESKKDHCDFVSLHRPFLVEDKTLSVP